MSCYCELVSLTFQAAFTAKKKSLKVFIWLTKWSSYKLNVTLFSDLTSLLDRKANHLLLLPDLVAPGATSSPQALVLLLFGLGRAVSKGAFSVFDLRVVFMLSWYQTFHSCSAFSGSDWTQKNHSMLTSKPSFTSKKHAALIILCRDLHFGFILAHFCTKKWLIFFSF